MGEIDAKLEAIHGDVRQLTVRMQESNEGVAAQLATLNTTLNGVVVRLVWAVIGAALGTKMLDLLGGMALRNAGGGQ